MKKYKEVLCNKQIRKKLEIVYGKKEGNKKAKDLIRLKLKMVLMIIIVTGLLTILLKLNDGSKEEIKSIKRNDYGGGTKKISLVASIANSEISRKMTVDVKEKEYSREEVELFEESIEKDISNIILNENTSLDEVRSNLNLVKKIDKYPFEITWKSEYPNLLNSNGEINKVNIRNKFKEECVDRLPVNICASLDYLEYHYEIQMYVVLTGNIDTDIDDFMLDVSEAIAENDKRSGTNEYEELPGEVNGIPLTFRKEESGNWIVAMAVGIILACGFCIAKDKEIDKEYLERQKEMDKDYPQILNQYALYHCAGMNNRAIWEEICQRYKEKKKESKESRYAYEEMLITIGELREGVGETAAYENFAQRCQNSKYRVFVNLIGQAVKKGSVNLSNNLYEEMEKARREENNRVRMSAQEMSTKLLIPMIMMLVVVLIIVLVPAFISLG